MSKNILIISDRFANGGLETHILSYVNTLKENKHNLFLLSHYELEYDYDVFEKKYNISFNASDTVERLFKHISIIKNIIEKENIAIVHVHPFLGIIPAFIATQQLKVPLFVTLHGPISIQNHYGPLYDFFLKILLFNYANIFLVSKELETLSLSYGKNENLIYLPNPIDTTLFKATASSKDIFEKWAIVSRLDDDKITGIQSCLKIAIQCKVKKVEIFGDGAAKHIMVEYIKTLHTKTEIIFHGFSTTLEKDLDHNYSLIAGMGRVALEAASLNIPVLLVGYDGIKGLLDQDLLLRSSWYNFSGRGITNISKDELIKEFQQIQDERSRYLLRSFIQEQFSIASVFPKYVHFLNTATHQSFPYFLEVKNIFKLSLNNQLPYLENKILLNRCLTLMKNTFNTSEPVKNNIDNFESEWSFNDMEKLTEENIILRKNIETKEQELRKLGGLQNQFDLINNELSAIKQSRVWRIATKYYSIRNKTFMTKNLSKDLDNPQQIKDLKKILTKYPTQTIMILPPLVDWNIPLFQRPQHLARNIAKQNILYFFSTPNGLYDIIDGFEEVSNGCYITSRFDLVDKITDRKKVYDLSSTDNGTDWEFVSKRLDRGDGIVYQYIDEISEEISGHKIPKSLFEKHFNILKDERCIIIPSATKLEDDVKEHRTKNYKLVTNGVEIEHFSKIIIKEEYPSLVKDLLLKNKPIIGYFGAFANWFDYELVIKLATERPGLEILLLGVDYDGSIKKYNLAQYDNITIAGPINYKELPKYAAAFSVSTIPFLINDITESTSPIKLFEYMAMGKPIVTTNMPECRKYESVLIGKNHKEFIEKIDEALTLRDDKSYAKLLEKEAEENSWESKAMDIVEMIEKNESKN